MSTWTDVIHNCCECFSYCLLSLKREHLSSHQYRTNKHCKFQMEYIYWEIDCGSDINKRSICTKCIFTELIFSDTSLLKFLTSAKMSHSNKQIENNTFYVYEYTWMGHLFVCCWFKSNHLEIFYEYSEQFTNTFLYFIYYEEELTIEMPRVKTKYLPCWTIGFVPFLR